jgi:4-hydroxy-tetrahydrodipicolinate reductase
VIAANFAIGGVLMAHLSAKAAPYFETVEIIESHHDTKKDAPSGTAIDTANRIAAASGQWATDPTEIEHLPGARGAKGAGGIPIHAVRMRGMVATQEVLFGATGQTLTIRHDTFDRTAFMPGVLLAVKAVRDAPGLTVGLEALLGLS